MMKMHPFAPLSQPIYLARYGTKMNISSLYVFDFSLSKKVDLLISGQSEYQIFLNGELVGYGPNKGSHHVHRYQKITLHPKGKSRLLILLAGFNTNTYDRVNVAPFLWFELKDGEKIITYSGAPKVKAYLYRPRFQKVARLSFQRAFSESYNQLMDCSIYDYGAKINLPEKAIVLLKKRNIIPSYVNHPTYENIVLRKIEKGIVQIDQAAPLVVDRYMFKEFLNIFPKEKWERSPSDVVSKFKFSLENINKLQDKTFATYAYKVSKTGFIRLKIEVKKAARVYLIFDEYADKTDHALDIKFYRNTTHNIIYYELRQGNYNLLSFEPYTVKYLRVVCFSGEIDIKHVGMVLLENPDTRIFKYQVAHPKITRIIKAGINTFNQNAVDILTDCPSRERAGWLCDSYFSGRSETFLTGHNRVEKSFLENYSLYQNDGQLPEGMIPMCYPGDFPDHNYIPNWSLFYLLELEDYLLRTGDVTLIEQSQDKIKGLLRYFEKFENEYGLLENLEGWVFVEWSKANDIESISGVNFPSNMLYARALIACSHLLGDDIYQEKAHRIYEVIEHLAFDGQFYHDNALRDEEGKLQRTNRIGETTQYYAFCFGPCKKQDHEELYSLLKSSFGPKRDEKVIFPNIYKSNAFIGCYLRLMMFEQYDEPKKILEETIDYFDKMAVLTGTLWEHSSVFASLNHGFTSYIVKLIVYALVGIKKIDYVNQQIVLRKDFEHSIDYHFFIPLGDHEFLQVKKDRNGRSYSVPEKYQIMEE